LLGKFGGSKGRWRKKEEEQSCPPSAKRQGCESHHRRPPADVGKLSDLFPHGILAQVPTQTTNPREQFMPAFSDGDYRTKYRTRRRLALRSEDCASRLN
jgi:hypothetical protein